ncbi:regulator of microtubule dynamics protein 1-like [Brevipalpus obovatus]|uniref:regulator of microtubule dynamics protein 1-like n=1 Tax=Brevipalpus obovatus TaxID=246614 RepID=UPI003D9F9DA3
MALGFEAKIIARLFLRRWISLARRKGFKIPMPLNVLKSVAINSSGPSIKYKLTPLLAISFGIQAKSDSKNELKKLYEQADKMFETNSFVDLINLLKSIPSWSENSEALWRIARAQHHQLKYRTDKASKEYMALISGALDYAQKAVELDETCGPAHKWKAIVLDEYASLHGLKARISQLMNFKNHMEKAIKYSPNDPTSHYLLGEWNFSCANVSWVERNVANVLFGKLPDASYEAALEMFQKAEDISPNFYAKNKLMLAKTLLAIGKDVERAKILLKDVFDRYRDSNKWDDVEAVNEAVQLLQKYGVKF